MTGGEPLGTGSLVRLVCDVVVCVRLVGADGGGGGIWTGGGRGGDVLTGDWFIACFNVDVLDEGLEGGLLGERLAGLVGVDARLFGDLDDEAPLLLSRLLRFDFSPRCLSSRTGHGGGDGGFSSIIDCSRSF